MSEAVPNPGSAAARRMGCTCPVLDNAHGKGWMGGAKDRAGKIVFVYTGGCPVHDPDSSTRPTGEER